MIIFVVLFFVKIKTVGTDDYDDILAMLKTGYACNRKFSNSRDSGHFVIDMKSLKAEDGSSLQPLNLQQRVIQSGLDSLQDDDAQNIVILFHGMAVFAEDQVFPVAILSVLWVSIDPDNHKPLAVMKARQWVSQLLSRSILLGSSSEISMHDLIRLVRALVYCTQLDVLMYTVLCVCCTYM